MVDYGATHLIHPTTLQYFDVDMVDVGWISAKSA